MTVLHCSLIRLTLGEVVSCGVTGATKVEECVTVEEDARVNEMLDLVGVAAVFMKLESEFESKSKVADTCWIGRPTDVAEKFVQSSLVILAEVSLVCRSLVLGSLVLVRSLV